MQHTYWVTEGKKHYVNKETIELMCFDLLNIFEASKGIVESRIETLEIPVINMAGEVELSDEKVRLLKLHHKYAFNQISKTILQLGLLIRTFDDQMKGGDQADVYLNQLSVTNKSNIGFLSGENKFNIRDACNKIIHSEEVEPLYSTQNIFFAENELLSDSGPNVFGYLSGEILLKGKFRKKPWEATLYVQNFIESVLELIHFEPETKANKASKTDTK